MDVPNLPGYRSNRPTVQTRPQNFTIVNGMVCERHPPPSVEVEHSEKLKNTMRKFATMSTRDKEMAVTTKYLSKKQPLPVPPEVENEKVVLRFHGYFQEAVPESPTEDFRVRFLDALFYVEDGTIQLIEPREHNSGIPQGTFLKRSRIPKVKAPGEYLEPVDLTVGSEIRVYGRVIRLFDADRATRLWYRERGVDQPPAETPPKDPVRLMQTATKKKDHHGKEKYDMKIFMEASLGKFQRPPMALKQFLDNDRKVLRFYCEWDDTASQGLHTNYVIHFFLADNTVEVTEPKVHNSGKDPFPALLSRQPLARDWRRQREAVASGDPSLFLEPSDFRVGEYVDIYGRNMLIKGCDPYTRHYYAEVLGQPQPAPLEGAEEESKQAATPPKPKKSQKEVFEKFMRHDGEVYRFCAKLDSTKPEDEAREFLIMVFPADDTVQIYETAARNSGIVAGKFLSRRKLTKPNGEPYTALDFPIGAVVELSAHRFRITNIDEYTKVRVRGLDDSAARGGGSITKGTKQLLDKMRDVLLHDNNVHGIHGLAILFRRMDKNSDNTLDKEELAAGVRDLSGGHLVLSDSDLNTLLQSFDANRSGRIDFNELLEGLRGKLTQRRRALVSAALAELNTRQDGRIPAADLVARFNFNEYEPVVRGFMSVESAKKDLLAQFNLEKESGIITAQDFIDYHRDVSAKYEDDEDFEVFMRSVWGLQSTKVLIQPSAFGSLKYEKRHFLYTGPLSP